MLSIDLSNQVAIVTGGDKGIGKSIADVLVQAGAIVYATSRDIDKGGNIISPTHDNGETKSSLQLDVVNQSSVDIAVKTIIEKHGRIDILVNNAGVLGASDWAKRKEENDEDWEMNYQVNLRGLARMTQAVAPFMKQKHYGKIVNIASNAGRAGNKDHIPSAYGATKAAVINLTQTNALELARYDINVNCVCPGIVWTPMLKTIGDRLGHLNEETKGLSPEEVYAWQEKTRVPLGRGQSGEDIGYMVAFLASELAKDITGQAINVNGGIRMN